MKTDYLEIYRKRYIPNELILLKDDEVLVYEPGKILITRWKTLNPKTDFSSGISAYLLDRGVKVSKMMCADGRLCRWYCDIVEYIEEPAKLTCVDLLFDVVILPDGSVEVLDIGEAADAFEQGLITKDQLMRGMRTTDLLLADIHSGRFEEIKQLVEDTAKTSK